MKYLQLLLFIVLLLSTRSAIAQGKPGKTKVAPPDSATVTLPHAKDSSVEAGVLQSPHHDLLRKLVVTAPPRLIEQKIDRIIVHVDAMITAAGSNALEVLARTPGVLVDINDGISLNGRNGVLVLIDGRPTYLSATDLAAYLRSLPAGMLDKIELMSNPPARYDASGSAIINIQLKKNRAPGFNGSLSLGYNQGVYGRSNDALNANFRNKKFNLSGNLSYTKDRNFSDETYSRYFYNPDGSLSSTLLTNSRYVYRSDSWNLRTGLDYFISAQTTVAIVLTVNTRPRTDLLNYSSHQYDGNLQLDSIAGGNTAGKYQWNSGSVNLNVQHKFDSAGQEITADLDYIHYRSRGNQFSSDQVYFEDGSLSSDSGLLFILPSDINIYSIRTDYTHPFKNKTKFDAGLKSSYVVTDNQNDWYDQSGAAELPDYSRTDHFIYRENVNAAYLNATKEWSRWAVQGGLRLENTQSKGHQPGNPSIADTVFSRSYTSLFPSFYLLYKTDSGGNNTLRLNFSRRIHRPNYQQLNPFLFYHDKYSYSAGNSGLLPSYSNFIGLTYSYKNFAGISFNYAWDNAMVFPVTRADGDLFITSPQNLLNRVSFGVISNISFSPAKCWHLDLNVVVIEFMNKGEAGTVKIDDKTNLHEIEIFNQFRFGQGWSAELNGFFPGSQSWGQSRSSPSYNISAGVQKTILKDKGTVRLKMDDIFHTMQGSDRTIDISQVSAFHTRVNDSRRVGLSFTYRFGREMKTRKRNQSNGGAEDERGRADTPQVSSR